MKNALLFLILALEPANAAEPPKATALKAAVAMPAKQDIRLGTLTLSAEQLDFDSPGLIFSLPVDAITEVEWAGFAERWLTIGIRPTSDFARAYPFLLTPGSGGAAARLSLLLPPNADLKTAIALAKDFKATADAAIAARQAAEQQAAQARLAEQQAAKAKVAEEAQQQRAAQQSAAAATIAASPPTENREPKVYVSMSAYYFQKKPGTLMTSSGLPGEIVLRSDGIGFAFHELGKLSDDRKQAITDNRIFLPLDSLQDCFVRDLRVLGTPNPTFFVVLVPRQNSELYNRLRPLLTDAGELLLHVRASAQRGPISQYLTRVSAHQF
jgi:hypothetical protein